jgi:hypothetical protein
VVKLLGPSRRDVLGLLLACRSKCPQAVLGQQKVPLSLALPWKDESFYPFLVV